MNVKRPRAYVRPMNLPNAPKPTLPVRIDDPIPSSLALDDFSIDGRKSSHEKQTRSAKAERENIAPRIMQLHEAGKSYDKIAKAVGCSSSTVRRIIKDFEAGNNK